MDDGRVGRPAQGIAQPRLRTARRPVRSAAAVGEHPGEVEDDGAARTFTPINLLDVRLRAGHRLQLNLRDGHTAGLFIQKGKVVVNGGEAANEAELVVFERKGDEVAIEAASEATVFVMNGQPIDEPIAGYGPFVMNTPQQIQQAIADY